MCRNLGILENLDYGRKGLLCLIIVDVVVLVVVEAGVFHAPRNPILNVNTDCHPLFRKGYINCRHGTLANLTSISESTVNPPSLL